MEDERKHEIVKDELVKTNEKEYPIKISKANKTGYFFLKKIDFFLYLYHACFAPSDVADLWPGPNQNIRNNLSMYFNYYYNLLENIPPESRKGKIQC